MSSAMVVQVGRIRRLVLEARSFQTLVADVVAALQLLVSSFSLTHKPSRISVSTVKGWITGIVTDGTETGSITPLQYCDEQHTT